MATRLPPCSRRKHHFKAPEMVVGCTAAHRSSAFIAQAWRYLWQCGRRLSGDAGLRPSHRLCNWVGWLLPASPALGVGKDRLKCTRLCWEVEGCELQFCGEVLSARFGLTQNRNKPQDRFHLQDLIWLRAETSPTLSAAQNTTKQSNFFGVYLSAWVSLWFLLFFVK